MPDSKPITAPTLNDAMTAACQAVGIVPRFDIHADGRWHYTDIDGERNGRGDARLMLFFDGQGGMAFNWKGEKQVFFVDDNSQALTAAELAELDRQRKEVIKKAEEEEARRRTEAAEKAIKAWKSGQPAGVDHPYLTKKGVAPVDTMREIGIDPLKAILGYHPKARGEELAGRVLVIPVKIGNKLTTCELIDGNGRKSAIAGGQKGGGFWAAQPLPAGDGNGLTFLIGEGVATVLSIREATGYPVVAALCCRNLEGIAGEMRKRYPAARLAILADIGNGQKDAEKAAHSVGGFLAVPDFGEDRPEKATDFNDLATMRGKDVVRACIEAALAGLPSSAKEAWPDPLPIVTKVEPEPYPVDALPSTIRAAVKEVQSFVKAPVPMVASSALAALSLACQAHVDAKRLEKLHGPVGLFLLTIADSGERKSTCDGFFTSPIREYEKEQAEAIKPFQKQFEAESAAWNAERDGLLAKIKETGKKGNSAEELKARLNELQIQEPERPRVPRLMLGDETPENLAWSLARRWPSAGVISSEAGLIFGAHGMGKESVMRNLGLLNILWDGGTHSVGRRTSESFMVKGARLTVALQIQEATLRSFFERSGELARGTGFLARFLVAWPESTQGFRLLDLNNPDGPATWPHLAEFHRRIYDILANPAPLDNDGGLSPELLTMTPEAKAAWGEFHNAIESELHCGGELYDVRDVASKTADNVARLAALFHVFEGGKGKAVSLEAIAGACRIAAWHLNEARRFFGELALPGELAGAARLDSWLMDYCRRERTTIVSVSAIQKSGPGGLRNKAAMEQAMRELEELNRIRRGKGPGKARSVEVNPALVGVAVAIPAVFAVKDGKENRKTAITVKTEAANPGKEKVA